MAHAKGGFICGGGLYEAGLRNWIDQRLGWSFWNTTKYMAKQGY